MLLMDCVHACCNKNSKVSSFTVKKSVDTTYQKSEILNKFWTMRHGRCSASWGIHLLQGILVVLFVTGRFAVESKRYPKYSWIARLPGKPYEMESTDSEIDLLSSEDGSSSTLWVAGAGREINLLDNSKSERPVLAQQNNENDNDDFMSFTSPRYRTTGGRSSYGSRFNQKRSIMHPVTDWWSKNITPNIKNWPKIQCRVEPTTTLKIRKTFRPLGTIVRLSANFNTQQGVWQFKSSWEDAIIGGKLTLAGMKELQLTKSWQLSVGPVEDLVTRLRLRAAVDLQTWKAYLRMGFRTERLSPINVMEGFSLFKQIPLDGTDGTFSPMPIMLRQNYRCGILNNFDFVRIGFDFSLSSCCRSHKVGSQSEFCITRA